MKIKDTLNLGKTDFPMRGKLPKKEVEIEEKWYSNNLYNERLNLNLDKKHFNLFDGPPYANGKIHMGHAMNKIVKDIILRYKNMNGFYAPFTPGWDTHGLPIEQELTKKGYQRKEMNITKWRDLANEYAMSQVNIQRDAFKRLGIISDWDNPYLTLSNKFESSQINVFSSLVKNDLVFRDNKPVYWSWSSESSLAEAEIEYKDIETKSIYYSNKIKEDFNKIKKGDNLIVWTTTPWTVVASEAITLGPEIDYIIFKYNNERFVVAKNLLDVLLDKFSWKKENISEIDVVKGKELEHGIAINPLNNNELIIANGEHVTTDSGTGLVHTAPGFGEDDYQVGLKYNLSIFSPVNDRGILTKEAGEDFEGTFYEKASEKVIDFLTKNNTLIDTENIFHSYPFDWRTKKPIIFRAIPQWFISIKKVKQNVLNEITNNIDFKPEWGKKRLFNMIQSRGDWVISRQRSWGVPLPIFYAEDETPILDSKVIDHISNLFLENGSNIWFEKTAEELLPEGYTNEHSPNGKFTKENDIMDVWFDSGSSWNYNEKFVKELDFPADLVFEGSDQFRGWFNSSLITSTAIKHKSSYKTLMSHGFVLDGNGEKMSKSLGNTILPETIINQNGADIVRMWVASSDFNNDFKVSNEIIKQNSDAYRKVRNTFRFLSANLFDFNFNENYVGFSDSESIDKYILSKLNVLIKKYHTNMNNYDILSIFKDIINFINVDLSSFYLDVAKDIVYIDSPNSNTRRSMQSAFYTILTSLTKIIHPILPHTSDEMWSYLQEKEENVYLSEMPQFNSELKIDEDAWKIFFEIRNKTNKQLEVAREKSVIGKNAEADVTLNIGKNYFDKIEKNSINVKQLLMVSNLNFVLSDEEIIEPSVKRIDGIEDPRDRLYYKKEDMDEELPMFSKKNADILRENFPNEISEGFSN